MRGPVLAGAVDDVELGLLERGAAARLLDDIDASMKAQILPRRLDARDVEPDRAVHPPLFSRSWFVKSVIVSVRLSVPASCEAPGSSPRA
jgi:hypothetical protein